jgi:hypothetical protein
VQHDDVAVRLLVGAAQVAAQRTLVHARVPVLAEIRDEDLLLLDRRSRDQPRELRGLGTFDQLDEGSFVHRPGPGDHLRIARVGGAG